MSVHNFALFFPVQPDRLSGVNLETKLQFGWGCRVCPSFPTHILCLLGGNLLFWPKGHDWLAFASILCKWHWSHGWAIFFTAHVTSAILSLSGSAVGSVEEEEKGDIRARKIGQSFLGISINLWVKLIHKLGQLLAILAKGKATLQYGFLQLLYLFF